MDIPSFINKKQMAPYNNYDEDILLLSIKARMRKKFSKDSNIYNNSLCIVFFIRRNNPILLLLRMQIYNTLC